MAEDEVQQDTDAPTHPLLERIKRAIAAHPILRDEKKLELGMKGRRVEVGGTVFTIDMYRQLIELMGRIPGTEDVLFTCEPQIAAPEQRSLEGRVPGVSGGPLPSDPFYSVRRKRGS